MKLEMLPPGQDATSIMPRATIGVIQWFRAMQIRNVTAGSPTHCSRMPVMMDLGWRNTSLKVSSLIPRATPNMMKASRMLTIIMPFSPKLMEMELRLSSCSFIYLRRRSSLPVLFFSARRYSLMALIPGSSFPSKNSSIAPPPVDT